MKTIVWVVLVAVLLVTGCGFSFCVVFLAAVASFSIGAITSIYIHGEPYADSLYLKLVNYSFRRDYVKKVSELMKKRKKNEKFDERLTGSPIIDEELRTILHYVFRDFVHPWYNKISDDPELPAELRETAHKIIIAIANRIKEVDWMPYLTTQLVDDVASHLRLYKQSRSKMKSHNLSKIETYFFDLEFTMEHGVICRDHICLNEEEEKEYLQVIADALLFQVLEESVFLCKSLRVLAREVLSEVILSPLLSKISDPDYINQTILWLCNDFPITSDIFLTVLKTTNSADELLATRTSVQKEVAVLRSKDAGSDSDSTVKNQLSSLLFLEKIIDVRLSRLQEGSDRDSIGLPATVDYSKLLNKQKLIQLPLDLVLKNNVALSYFIDYMSSIGSQVYIFAYLNMEGWRTSARQELAKYNDVKAKREAIDDAVFAQLTSAARLLYEQYLTEKTSRKLVQDTTLVRAVYIRIHSELPSENWFDDILHYLFHTMQNEPKFLPCFRTSPAYVKLLVELELIREPFLKENDDEDGTSADECAGSSSGSSVTNSPVKSINKDPEYGEPAENLDSQTSAFTLSAKIIETGLVQENGRTFGVYAIAVTKLFGSGQCESWHVYRRYSDFYELHQKLKERYPDISHIPFPGKKTFNNMERNVREKRMKMLNDYMRILLQLSAIKSHPGVQNELLTFLESEYDKGGASGQLAKTFDNLVINPLKVVGNAVKTMPDNLLNTVDGMMEGFSKVFTKSFRSDDEEETMKVSSEIDVESHNIPLRIMLLFMTEVFDLKTRNQWLRKRIITLVRQIMQAMFGDIVNRRILDYMAVITSPSRVALCLANIKNSIWPNSVRAEPASSRDKDIRMRTRVAAKCALLASFSDDLKHILGSETSRAGIMLLFSMFQHQILNKRLVFVILEGFLVTLFPNLNALLVKLHAQSPRVLQSTNNRKKKK